MFILILLWENEKIFPLNCLLFILIKFTTFLLFHSLHLLRSFVRIKMTRYSTILSSSTTAVAATARGLNLPQQQHNSSSIVAATYSSSSSQQYTYMWIGFVWGFGDASPWAVSAPDLDVGGWAWVQTRVNRPALSRRAGVCSLGQERRRRWAWLTRCVFYLLRSNSTFPNVRTSSASTKRHIPVLYFRTERMPAGGG